VSALFPDPHPGHLISDLDDVPEVPVLILGTIDSVGAHPLILYVDKDGRPGMVSHRFIRWDWRHVNGEWKDLRQLEEAADEDDGEVE
jgi:hypothetical protein